MPVPPEMRMFCRLTTALSRMAGAAGFAGAELGREVPERSRLLTFRAAFAKQMEIYAVNQPLSGMLKCGFPYKNEVSSRGDDLRSAALPFAVEKLLVRRQFPFRRGNRAWT